MTPLTRRASLALFALPALWRPRRAAAYAAEEIYIDGAGIALRGYDPAAFFLQNSALRGSWDHERKIDGVTWHFYSAANADAFADDPAALMPQFGGFCAEAMARGTKRASDPELWVKIDGKVYLHYSVEVQNLWAADIRGNIAKAEANWPEVKGF
jgi:hypothetical protein